MSTRSSYVIITAIVLLAQYTIANVIPEKEVIEETKTAVTEATKILNGTLNAEETNADKAEVTQSPGIESITETESAHSVAAENSADDDATTDDYYENYSTEDDFPEQVVHYAYDAVGNQSKEYLIILNKFFVNFLKDAQAYDGPKKDELDEEIFSFEQFVNDFHELEEDDNTFYKIHLLYDIVHSINEYYEEKKEAKEEKAIDELFKKLDLSKILIELNTNAKDVMKDLRHKIQDKWQQLSAEERGTQLEFDRWFKSFVKDNVVFGEPVIFIISE